MASWSTTDILAAFTFVVLVVTVLSAAIAGWFERRDRARTLREIGRNHER